MASFAPEPTYDPVTKALVTNQRLPVGSSVSQFSTAFSKYSQLIGIEVQANSVYVTFDGTTPSATNGNNMASGTKVYWSPATAQNAKFIQNSGAAVVMAIELHVPANAITTPPLNLI